MARSGKHIGNSTVRCLRCSEVVDLLKFLAPLARRFLFHEGPAGVGLAAEVARTLRPGGRVCTVTDSEDIIRRRQPLSVYFPESVAVELARYPKIADLEEAMGMAGFTGIHAKTVEYGFITTDIQAYRDRAFSSLHLISEAAFQAGIRRMEADLQKGPIQCVPRYLLLWGIKP